MVRKAETASPLWAPDRPATQATGLLLARSSLYNFLGQVLPLLVAVASIPYVVRGLGPERFGLLSLAWVVLGYFTLFDLGLGRATTKYVAELVGRGEEQRVSQVVWTSLAFQLGFGLLGAALLFLGTPFLVERVLHVPPELAAEARQAFTVLSLGVPVVLVSSSLSGALEGRQRFDLVNAVRIPASAGTYLLPALGVALQADLAHIVLLIIAWRAAAAGAFLWANRRASRAFRPTWPSRALARSLLRFGAWVTISNLATPVFVYLDRFLIGSMLTLSAVTYYAAPYELVTRVLIIPYSLATVLFPAFSRFFKQGSTDELNSLVMRAAKYIILVMAPIVAILVVFAHMILATWLGNEFASRSVGVFKLLSFATLLNAVGFVPFVLIQAYGRPDVIAKYYIIELPIYAIVVVALIKYLEINGAALAWFLRMVWTIPIFFYVCTKLSSVDVKAFAQSSIRRSLAVAAGLLVASLSLGGWCSCGLAATALLTGTLLAGYAALLWWTSLDHLDKDLVRHLVGAFRRISWHIYLSSRRTEKL